LISSDEVKQLCLLIVPDIKQNPLMSTGFIVHKRESVKVKLSSIVGCSRRIIVIVIIIVVVVIVVPLISVCGCRGRIIVCVGLLRASTHQRSKQNNCTH
jgi:hypothetical protein